MTGTEEAYVVAVLALAAALHFLRRHPGLFSLASLPGTFVHEMAHWSVGFVLLGRPTRLTIVPRKVGGVYQLGAVSLANIRWYNGLLIGLAPLGLLPLALWIVRWRMEHFAGAFGELPWAYFSATLLVSSVPSRQDLRIAAVSSVWLLVLLAGYLAFHFRIIPF